MKIVLFGPPGAGKGTQAEKISNMYNILHISTGELLRKNIEEKTQIGLVALEYIERGKLAPDEVVLEVVNSAIKGKDSFLLDGFPRTVPQAEALDKITDIDIVLNIKLNEALIVDRILNRLVCPACGKNYNKRLYTQPDCTCGARLTSRKDDTEEVVRERLKVYASQTLPLIGYYQKRNKLVDIDGTGSVDEVFARISEALNDFAQNR